MQIAILQGLGVGQDLKLNKKMIFCFVLFLLVMPKYEGEKKISFLSIPEVDEKQKALGGRRRKVGEKNGQLSFRPPPRVTHASRLYQKCVFFYIVFF